MSLHFPRLLSVLLASVLSAALSANAAKLNIVTTTTDLGALAQAVGGDAAKVTSLALGTEDPHFVDAKPSFIRVLNRADGLIEGGAELETGWLPPLVNGARNAKILGNSPGHVIASRGVRLLGIPTTPVDRSQGDVHPLGNPHYLLDPLNDRIVARALAERFAELEPSQAGVFRENERKFEEKLQGKLAEWERLLAPYRGAKVITYHKSWDYFLDRFGLELAGTLEPKPGIEPSPTHIAGLVRQAKGTGVKLIVIDSFRPRRTPQQVAEMIGAKLVVLPLMPGGDTGTTDFFGWFDFNVQHIAEALKP